MDTNASDKFDVCVIGCGPAGFAGAMRALDLGKHVCIVESGEIGGAGVMWGALASKTMWELAKDYYVAGRQDRGYHATDLKVDYRQVRQTVFQAVKEKQYQMLSQIESFSSRLWKGPGSLTLKTGWGSFESPHSLRITYGDNSHEVIEANFFLIATGSKPRQLSHIATDQEVIFDSDGILGLKKFPPRLLIIGAGIIGCEYATIFSNYGQSKVYLVDHKERILPFEDEDISAFVDDSLRRRGVEIFHSAQLSQIKKNDNNVEAILEFAAGHCQILNVNAVLVSIGRQPDPSGLNLEKAGVSADPSGFLMTDENCCVGNNIYAAGDVTPHPALVNIAETEGRYAVKHMFNAIRWPLYYENMSTVMFFYPAVAAVGLNEKACRRKKIPYRVAFYSNALLSRAIAMRSLNGFVKIIVSDDEKEMILGMRAAGPQVSNNIMSIAMLMDQGKSLKEVLKSVHPHPTMSEGIQECLRVLLDKSIYKSTAFPDKVKIRTWRPD